MSTKILAVIMTIGLCFQRLSNGLMSFCWGVGLAAVLYYAVKMQRSGELTALDKDYREHFRVMLICIASMLPSFLLSEDPLSSAQVFANMWIYRISPLFIAPLVIRRADYLRTMLLCFGAVFAIDCGYAVWQVCQGDLRAGGFSGHHNNLGSITAVVLPMLAVLCLDNCFSKKVRIFALFVLIMGFCGSIASNSRTSWVALIVTMPIVCAYYLRRDRKMLIYALIVVALLGGFFVSSQRYSERFLSSGNSTTNMSNLERLHMWNTCMYVIKEHPFGIGIGQFKKVFRRDYQPIYATPRSTMKTMPHAHSNYIHILLEGGIIGFAGFCYLSLWLFWHNLREWLRRKDPYSLMIWGAWLSFLICGIFDYFMDHSAILKMWWFILGALLVLRKENNDEEV